MAVYTLSVACSQATTVLGIPAPGDTLPLEEVALDPAALGAPLVPPLNVSVGMDPRWRLIDSELQPSGVGLSVARGQIAFRLTQAIGTETTAIATTGPSARPDEVSSVASGPYRLRDSAIQWQNAQFPATWGDPDEVVARARLVGADPGFSIEVTFTNGQIVVSHTDDGATTVDYTNDLSATPLTREDEPESMFRWLRIESDGAGTTFWVYASTDGEVWHLLVSQTMSADMQAAFVRSSLEFSMTASGTNHGSGAWIIGSINVAPGAALYPGLYLNTEDQGGFAYNAGVWSQFGPPLDGWRSGFTYDGWNLCFRDSGGNPHYNWVSAVAYAPDDYNVVYALEAGHALLWTSTNGGLSWSSQRMPFAEDAYQPEEVDPAAPLSYLTLFDVVCPHAGEVLVFAWYNVASANIGIWRTTNGGTTWTRVLAPFTPEPGFPTQLMPAGGMRASDSKVWWAQQTGHGTMTTPPEDPLPVPEWHIVWAGSLDFAIDIDDLPENQPVLEIPPLSVNTYTRPDGTTGTTAYAYITLSTPGVWAPNMTGDQFWVFDPLGYKGGELPAGDATDEFVLWEDGLVTVWQDPDGIPGVYGPVGIASQWAPRFFWQPPEVSDGDVETYWAMTSDMIARNRQVTAWNKANPGVPLPPSLVLPDLGGYQGNQVEMHTLSRIDSHPEPTNATAGISRPAMRVTPEAPIDYLGAYVPHMPESSASAQQFYLTGITPGGGKLHVVSFDDVPLDVTSSATAQHSSRRAVVSSSGCVSVVILDVEPADLALYLAQSPSSTSANIQPTTGALRAVGSNDWSATLTTPATSSPASRLIGPPGHLEVVNYTYRTHPVYTFTEAANYPTLPSSAPLIPIPTPPLGQSPYGGILLATQVVFGDTHVAVPDGWTLIEGTEVTSSFHENALGGRLRLHTDVDVWRPAYGFILIGAESKFWSSIYDADGIPIAQAQLRDFLWGEVRYDLRQMSQRMIWRPFAYDAEAPETIPLPVHSQPYWILCSAANVLWRPPTEEGSATVRVRTDWAINRANFDGTGQQMVGSLSIDHTEFGARATRLQVRPLHDDLCVVSSYHDNGVWLVQSGRGAVATWSTELRASAFPWDAIALEDGTLIAIASVIPPPAP